MGLIIKIIIKQDFKDIARSTREELPMKGKKYHQCLINRVLQFKEHQKDQEV